MNPRIYGLETEMGTIRRLSDGRWIAGANDEESMVLHVMNQVLGERIGQFIADGPGGASTVNQFAGNGARIYLDGGHVEYATPECSTPQEVIAADSAGMELLSEWFSKPILGGQRLIFIKENAGFTSRLTSGATEGLSDFFGPHVRMVSFGCHENYSLNDQKLTRALLGAQDGEAHIIPNDFVERTLNRILPFLITRPLIAGAGTFNFGRFSLSNRSHFINCVVGQGTIEGSRAILCTKYRAPGPVRRLHLILGDATMSEISSLLKFGTTALVLSLAEEGLIPSEWALAETPRAVNALQKMADDPTGQAIPIPLFGGRKANALTIQRQFYECAAKHFPVSGSPRWLRRSTREILYWWDYALRCLEAGESEALVGILDWPTKRALGERFLASYGIALADLPNGVLHHPKRNDIVWELRALEQKYHEISEDGYYVRLKRAGAMQTIIPRSTVMRLKEFPPRRTRAWARGSLIRWAHCRWPWVQVTADWTYVNLHLRKKNAAPAEAAFTLDNPFAPFSLWITDFFRKMAPNYPREDS